MNAKTKGILIGGILGGLLSVIPLVNMGNCVCCLWIILGGAVASGIYARSSPYPVSLGDGTLTGLLAAIPMVLIYIVIGIPLNLILGQLQPEIAAQIYEAITGDAGMAEMMRHQARQPLAGQIIGIVIGVVFWVLLAAGFSTLGGLIGAAIFAGRDPGPPEGYGGYPGGPPGGYQPPSGPGYPG